MGIIELRDMEERDEWRELYETNIGIFKNTNHAVEFTAKRKVYLSTDPPLIISNDYIFSSEGLRLKSTNPPNFFITEEKAKEKLNQIFEHYYSPEWKQRVSEPKGNRERAIEFLRNFQELKFLRSNFAPAYYNEACMYSILGNTKMALQSLKRAFGLDKSYKAKALTDPDLKAVRELSEFENLDCE